MEKPVHEGRLAGRAKTGKGLRWAAALVALVATAIFAGTWVATPSTLGVRRQVTAVDSAHGAVPLSQSQIPHYLADAIVAMEDQSFYQDHGVNLQGLLRAAAYDVVHLCKCQGGSTITEQLAEDIYMGGSDRSIWGRWWDIVLALKIEDHLTKNQVLDAYLSQVYLGHGAVGAQEASHIYFRQSLKQDDLAQLALLAGLPQSPSLLDPLVNPEGARERRAAVLEQMAADGYITFAQARLADSQPVL